MKIPKHVAIILDGNGRWAKSKGMPRNYGHTIGAKNVETVCQAADEIGIKYLTLYAFSTENWNRPDNEVQALMKLLESYLNGKTKINTSIVYYQPEENGYSGSIICALYYGENSNQPDAYFSAGYDFHDKTESYLGMGTHISSDYGIHPYEIVDITFTEPITDVNKIFVKMFEYIAD